MFPEASRDNHVTVVVPSGNSGGALLPSVGERSQTSAVVAEPSATGVPDGEVHSPPVAAGAVTVGCSVSTIAKRGEMSKKMLPFAASRMRPFAVGGRGTVNGSEPSFAVLPMSEAKLAPLSPE